MKKTKSIKPKYKIGDLVTLTGLYNLTEEEKYKLIEDFPEHNRFIGIIIHVGAPRYGYKFENICYRVDWLEDSGFSGSAIFFEGELDLVST